MELNLLSGEVIPNIQETESRSSRFCFKLIRFFRSISKSAFNYIKEGSSVSSITILLASSLGSTMVIVSQCIYDMGFFLAVFLLLLTMAINYFACYCLIRVSDKTGMITYKGLGDTLYGNKYGTVFEVSMVLASFIKVVVYVILMGTIIAHNFDSGIKSRHVFWYIFIVIVIFPLTLMRNISKLRYFVIISIIGSAMYLCTATAKAFNTVISDDFEENLSLFTANPLDLGYLSILKYVAQFLISFSCQPNILSVYEETDYKTVKKGINNVLASYSILAGMYLILGSVGSLIILKKNQDFYHILYNYEDLYPLASSSIFLLILGKTHLRLFPCRDGIYSTLWSGDIIVPRKKHIIVCTLILVCTLSVVFFTELALDSSGYMEDYSLNLYLEGLVYLIDPVVRNILGIYSDALHVLHKKPYER